MEKEKEIRNVSSQFKIAGEGDETRTVEGYAFLFNVPSDGLSFQETIEPGAADGVIAKSDVFAVLNHGQERGILARSKYGKGSLSLTVDEKGLRYSFEAPKTALGDELLENLRRGEIDQSSFCFDVEKDAWEKGSDGTWKRTISKIGNLYDVSPVYNAAYSKTSVCLRGKEQAEKEIEARESLNLDEYYSNIEKSLNI